MSLESLPTYALLDSVQQEVSQVAQQRRKDLPTHDLVKTILDSLDIIIHRSYDQHTTVSIERNDEGEDESGDGMKVTFGDMTTAKRIASGWLIKVISGEYADGDDASMDRAAHVMAHFSGRGGKGHSMIGCDLMQVLVKITPAIPMF
jgi:hypothetical protein